MLLFLPDLPAKNLYDEGLPMRSVRFLSCLVVCCLMTARAIHSQDVLTPVIASPLVAQTYAVQGTGNKQHVVYELVITDSGTATATLQKIEIVIGDASQKVLATAMFKASGAKTFRPSRRTENWSFRWT
jgi:hypothetical protein